MKNLYAIIAIIFLNLISISIAWGQSPIDAIAGPLQEKINAAGQQLPEKAAKHFVEGNLTQEHIIQDLSATKENITEQANKQLNSNLNINTEQLKQKAEEELKNQVNQKIAQQPGFTTALAWLGILLAFGLTRKRN